MKKYTTKDVQSKLLEIVKDFDAFCRKNNIRYYLMGGSALGAMRHKGFIPWDDDIDVFMEYDEYHRFLRLAKEKMSKKYFIQEENTDAWPLFLSQVRLNGTTFIGDDYYKNKKMHHGLFIDVMCLYNAPKNTFKRKIQYLNAMWLKTYALNKVGYERPNKLKMLILKLSGIVVNKYTKKHFIKAVSKYQNRHTDYVGHFFGRARFKYTSFPKEYLGKPRYVDFEDTKLPVMQHVEKYLAMRYGDTWHEMPDKKTLSQYPAHGAFIDLEKDYTEYINEYEKA